MSGDLRAAVEPGPAAGAPSDPAARLVEEIPALAGIASACPRGQQVLFPDRARYVEAATALKAAGFATCADLTAADYLRHPPRRLPAGLVAERFEVVAVLLSHERRSRVRLRVQVPEAELVCPTLFFVYPGTEAMEREAYDLFGIRFEGHPDPTRILMPEDWEGHPLRKDYSVGRVPVQFKDAPGPR